MRRGFSRFIPIIFVIVIFILIIAAGISIVRLFAGGGTPDSSQVAEETVRNQALLNTDAGHSVVMRLRGPIVGDEDFRSYEVTVSSNSRQFNRYKGYLDTPLVSKTYDNNTKAYDEFVHALATAKFADGTPFTGDKDDTRGLCSSGILYEFEIVEGGDVQKRLWTTTCKGSKGSLDANVDQLRELFLAQVPDAQQYIGKD